MQKKALLWVALWFVCLHPAAYALPADGVTTDALLMPFTTPEEQPTDQPTETPTDTSTATPTPPCSIPTVSEFGGFDPDVAPELDEIINLPSIGIVDNQADPTYGREHWVWTIPPEKFCSEQISEIQVSLPIDSEIPYDWSLDVTVQMNAASSGDLPEISIDFGRGGSYVVLIKHIDGSERVLDVRAGIISDASGVSIVALPGTAAANGEACRSIAGRRIAIRTTTHTKLRPDPAHWGNEALSVWAARTFPNSPTVADWNQLADQMATPDARNRTVAVLGHGLNSEFHFRPDPARAGAPANNLPRVFTVDHVAPFLQRLRAALGNNNEIPGLYFSSCCTANTQGNNDLLTALTRAGSPIAEACGTIRAALLERQLIRGPGPPAEITMDFIEEGSWRCVLRPPANN